MGQPNPILEGSQAFGSDFRRAEVPGHHGDRHRQPHQPALIGLLELLAGRADLATVDGARIEEDEVSRAALHQLPRADVGVSVEQLDPIAAAVPCHLVAPGQFVLGVVVVGPRDHLESSSRVGSHVHQRHHALHAAEAALLHWILIHMQVLHEGLPALLSVSAPPGPPADKGVEAGDELVSGPDGREGSLDPGVGADEPGGVGVAAAVGDEEADGAAAWPAVVLPGLGVVALDAAVERLQPLPEAVGGGLHVLLREDTAQHDVPLLVEMLEPELLLLQLERVILLLSLKHACYYNLAGGPRTYGQC